MSVLFQLTAERIAHGDTTMEREVRAISRRTGRSPLSVHAELKLMVDIVKERERRLR